MALYVTPTLEFSPDALSDTTPTYTDVTAYLLEATWSAGVQKEGDGPQPGQAQFLLDDRTRRFEPDYAAGTFYPGIVPDRRFRFQIVSSAVTYEEGTWFAAQWQPSWPDAAINQLSAVTCGDGMQVLAFDPLPSLDPPDAESYSDVVEFDEPWGYWRLGEPEGTQAVAQFRKGRRNRRGRRRKVRVGTRYVTAAEAGGAAGATGTYWNTPALGQDGAIVGDTDTCVLFGPGEHVRFSVEGTETFSARNRVSAECWVYADTWGTIDYLIFGPDNASSSPIFILGNENPATDGLVFRINTGTTAFVDAAVGSATATDTWLHVVGTFDGQTIRLYVNGVLEAETGYSGQLPAVSGAQNFQVASDASGGFPEQPLRIDEPAIYEHVLSPERILAHYIAGSARGFPQQTAGERISAIVTSGLWAETEIQTAGRDVQPVMMFGQSRLDEIADCMQAEGPRTMFFFNGDGNPVYLGHEWQSTDAAYNTVQATFGNTAGEVPYQDIELVYDDEFYTTVHASKAGGPLVEATTGATPDRMLHDYTDTLLVEDNEVESLAENVLDFYETPAFRPVALHLDGADTAARLQILSRQIGDMIRIKHRPKGGTAIDRIVSIIGYTKKLTQEDGLTCTWHLSRGFNAAPAQAVWRAGVVGLSEAGSTTYAG